MSEENGSKVAEKPKEENVAATATTTTAAATETTAAARDQPLLEDDKEKESTAINRREIYKCRMYENEFPNPDDLVMVRVNRISEICAFVSLLEYNNKEGIIMLSEISRRRMRSINKHIRIGKEEVLQVLRVDKDKGYIDLSKKNVVEDDIEACRLKYMKARTVHSIMANVATNQDEPKMSLEELYKMVGWPLYEKYGHAYESFKKAAAGEDIFEGLNTSIPLTEAIKDLLLKTIKHRLGSQPVKVQADIQVTCFTYEGIDAIKPALKAGMAVGTEEHPVKVQLVSSPEYILTTSCTDPDFGIALLRKAIEEIKVEIKRHGGDCVVKADARTLEGKLDSKDVIS